jgi:hypothetical protein
MCNRFPLKCEFKRETDGRNNLQIIQWKSVVVGEPGKGHKQTSNNIHICFIPKARIPMLRIRVDSKNGC